MSNALSVLAMRGKILGVLIKDARLAAGKIPQECAEAAGVGLIDYNAWERGSLSPSLPELELLAHFLGVPLAHFWSNTTLSGQAAPREAGQLPVGQLNQLRHRVIGTQLRQARQTANMPLQDLAGQISVSAERLSEYEAGHAPVPLPELEVVVARLGLNIEDLLDRSGPIGEWDSTRRDFERFRQLPAELREFASQPLNQPFLQLARQLAEMPADKLRGIAASLLDITL